MQYEGGISFSIKWLTVLSIATRPEDGHLLGPLPPLPNPTH
jgi:hypothetical protein